MSDSAAPSPSLPCQDTCARCILLASQGEISCSDDLYRSLASFSNGLGVGSICCGLLGAAMLLGLNCPENEAKQKTLLLFQTIQEKYGSLYCPRLKTPEDDCQALLQDIQRLTQEILNEP